MPEEKSKIMVFNIITTDESETENAGERLAAQLLDGDFVALYGDLGAGKTAFVRGMARVLAPGSHVCSPTYNIVNIYKRQGGSTFCHFDMYRISSEDDLISCGFYDMEKCIIAAEWCENIPYALPEQYYSVKIEKLSENTRRITAERHGDKN